MSLPSETSTITCAIHSGHSYTANFKSTRISVMFLTIALQLIHSRLFVASKLCSSTVSGTLMYFKLTCSFGEGLVLYSSSIADMNLYISDLKKSSPLFSIR